MTAAIRTGRGSALAAAELREMLDTLYPGRLALLLVRVCSPTIAHRHRDRDGAESDCTSPGKRPLGSKWNIEAGERWRVGADRDAHLDAMAQHLERGGNIGWAVPPGALALDADTTDAVRALEVMAPDAPMQETAKGGHFIVRVPTDLELGAKVRAEIAPGIYIDARTAGRSQIVCEPSIHATGTQYGWVRELPDDLDTLPECPASILAALVTEKPKATAASTRRVGEGARNAHLYRVGCGMRGRGMTGNEIADELHRENARHCSPPLDSGEVDAVAASVLRYAAGGIADEAQAETPRSYLHLVPTLDELAAMAAAPPIVPLVTHLLYPAMTTVLVGQTNTGKTTATLRAAVDLAYGREPWTGRRDGRAARRVLMVSKDDTTLSLVRKLAALAPDAAWMQGGITLIGKEKRPVALDDHGVEMLGNTVADGGFDVFVLDPYQHFLPPGLTVNDDEGARHTIDALDGLCASTGCAGLLIHHPRKRAPKAKGADEMTKGERLEEIRGSAVLAQLARSVATLWETEPGRRMLDAVVNDVPPLAELWFETSRAGDYGVRWEIAGPPTDAEDRAIRERAEQLDVGLYNASTLARVLFEIPAARKPSGQRRTQAKAWALKLSAEHPGRFAASTDGLEVLG